MFSGLESTWKELLMNLLFLIKYWRRYGDKWVIVTVIMSENIQTHFKQSENTLRILKRV